ncbi:MAG: cytochrome c biogenesis protein CcsA [Prevotellaceae bacterium]|jgi:ABC-type transport system involved in cytochrome c biogenesis permease subunit|nr:cytochrome c biogenesis protein CcsA [Prevotellaceae bacterium]
MDMFVKYSKYCAFVALAVTLLTLVAATVVEKVAGREVALVNVYGAWWFVALWGALALAAFSYIICVALYRNKPAFLLHVALAVILCGALVTFATAERGYIHLRQGETVRAYTPDKETTTRPLPFDVKLVLFDIEYHPNTNTPADFISFLKIDDAIARVSMNKIYIRHGYRLYQMDYDPDEMGSTLLVNRDPWGIGLTYAGYGMLTAAMLWLLWRCIGWRGMLWTALPVTGLWMYISQLNPMTPVLRSPMLAAHVSVIMASYALLLFIAVTAIAGLCSRKQRLRFYRWNMRLLYPAVFLLAAGIFIGAVWANISWGRYWGWDAKETWALITLLVYAVPFHRQSLAYFRSPYRFHLYCAIAFATVAMTFFGVSFLLGGIHSYV